METLYSNRNELTDKNALLLIKMLQENLEVQIPVTGNSMLPLWKQERDFVTLKNCNSEILKKGDVPLYRRTSGKLVMHRIIQVNKDSYDLCGDAQVQIEYHVPKSNMIGVVKSYTRKGKYYSSNGIKNRIYSRLWILLLPFRKIVNKVSRKIVNKVYRKRVLNK